MAMYDLYQSEAYLRRDAKGAWFAHQIPKGGAGTSLALALSASGLAHVAHWTSAGGSGWQLYWYVPGMKLRQKVHPLGSSGLSNKAIGLAVTGAGVGTPHVLFARVHTQNVHNLTHAWRSGTTWKSSVLETDGSHTCGKCTNGATCTYDYSTYRPMAVVASGNGDVRLLYARTRYHGTKVGKQNTYPPFSCTWSGGKTTGYIHMAWPKSGGGHGKATLLSDALLSSGGNVEAELDAKGNIHTAVYTYNTAQTGTEVRYLKIGM